MTELAVTTALRRADRLLADLHERRGRWTVREPETGAGRHFIEDTVIADAIDTIEILRAEVRRLRH